MRVSVWRAAFAALCLATWGAAHAQAPVDSVLSTSVLQSGRMTVAVTIQGGGPHPFIVDTGAERTVIARDLVETLALQPAGRARLLSMTSSRPTDKVAVPDLAFTQGSAQTLVAFALERENIGAAGVLGIDALRGQRIVFDFKAGEVRVGPSQRKAVRTEPNEVVVYGRARFGQLVLADADVDGRPVDVVVDSGLSTSLGNEALRDLLVSRRGRFQPVELVSITGEALRADYTQVDTIRIGGLAVAGLPVAFSDAYIFRKLRLTRRPALLLGMDALRLFDRVTVDPPSRRAQFVLPDRSSRRQR